jgi:hypothetical protein
MPSSRPRIEPITSSPQPTANRLGCRCYFCRIMKPQQSRATRLLLGRTSRLKLYAPFLQFTYGLSVILGITAIISLAYAINRLMDVYCPPWERSWNLEYYLHKRHAYSRAKVAELGIRNCS